MIECTGTIINFEPDFIQIRTEWGKDMDFYYPEAFKNQIMEAYLNDKRLHVSSIEDDLGMPPFIYAIVENPQ